MRAHWPEYVIEAAGLGVFMFVACVLGAVLGHPDSGVVHALPDPLARRTLMGLAMGLTAVGLIYSPWGRRSGAHFNPATTLTFWRLGKVSARDAVADAGAQALGGLAGVLLAAAIAGPALAHPEVRYVVTVPGAAGVTLAFVAELAITTLARALPGSACAMVSPGLVAPPARELPFARSFLGRDPDGHAFQIVQR